MLRDLQGLRLRSPDGSLSPLQVEVLDRWSDGSVRWALLDWQVHSSVGEENDYLVEIDERSHPEPASPRIEVLHEPGKIHINTQAARFDMRAEGPFPFQKVLIADRPAIDPASSGLSIVDHLGQTYRPRVEHLEEMLRGPLRSVVRLAGSLMGPAGQPLGRFDARLHFFAGLPTVRFDLALHNPRKSGHPGNLWNLGDDGSIYIKDAVLTLALPSAEGPVTVEVSPELGAPLAVHDVPMELYQDSSGGENWQSSAHVNRKGLVPNSFRGYRLRTPQSERAGRRATPIVSLSRGGQWLGVAMEYFWQNFPKAIEATPAALFLRLFPGQYADVHELQGGERKTHTFWVSFDRDTVTDVPMHWCRSPLRPSAESDWYCSTNAVPRLSPRATDPHTLYLELVDAAVDGADTFEHKREVIDEYGWRHFGEIYADHEAVFCKPPDRLVSHYNNQYDPIAGAGLQFLRSGDWRWWRIMHELALHVRDIDIYHTDEDKSAYNHGLFWHTCHYVDAIQSTHRSYPRAPKVFGGGPSGGHNYPAGLMLHHFLTGDPLSREAAIELARWVISMDDGNKTILRWISGEHTGHATSSGTFSYHGPGRAPANSLDALLVGSRLTGQPEFLEKAEQIIRRCIHPADDIVARNLLDAENKWFYNMFLQALGRYLDFKAEKGQLDDMYAYARSSLLNYARWMAENEYPYLEKPELLEYPTETWAAQDMRKSEVFEYAARLADSKEEREVFLERSRYFFQASTQTLAEHPTRSLARPVVLLLSNGLTRSYSEVVPDFASLPRVDRHVDFGRPEVFLPQKTRAMRRLKRAAAVAVALVVVLASVGAALLALRLGPRA
jgi:hypothetical protein